MLLHHKKTLSQIEPTFQTTKVIIKIVFMMPKFHNKYHIKYISVKICRKKRSISHFRNKKA